MATKTRKEKNQSVYNIEGFLGAAMRPDRIELMAQLQIGQSMLDEGHALMALWHERKALLGEANLKLDDAIKAGQETRKAASLEMTALIMFFRRQYYNDDRLLRSLGLGTQRRTVPVEEVEDDLQNNPENQSGSDEPKTRKVAITRSRQESERLALWRSMLDCIPKLGEDVRQRLELVGFDQARLDQIKAAVEAFAAVLPIRKVALAERKERTRLLGLVERDLNTWMVLLRATMAPKIRLIRDQSQQDFLALVGV